jgi:hypothetical protein
MDTSLLPTPEEIILRFEKKYKITLPEDYSNYLIESTGIDDCMALIWLSSSTEVQNWNNLPNIHQPFAPKALPDLNFSGPEYDSPDEENPLEEEEWWEHIDSQYEAFLPKFLAGFSKGTLILEYDPEETPTVRTVLVVTGDHRGHVYQSANLDCYPDLSGGAQAKHLGSFTQWIASFDTPVPTSEPVNTIPPLCPQCEEYFDNLDNWYCATCDLFFCPLCESPCKIDEAVSSCEHFTIGYLGGMGIFFDDVHPLEDTLKTVLEQPLPPSQEDYLNGLTDDERIQHFGSPEVIDNNSSLWDFIEKTIPQAVFAYKDESNWIKVGFSALGSQVAWQKINKALEHQRAGREWLQAQVQP